MAFARLFFFAPGAIDTILDIYKMIFNEFGGYLTHNCEINLRGLQVMMKEIGSLEDEVLRDRRKKEKRFEERRNQKAFNIQAKRSSKQHLELIRRLTNDGAAHAVPLGQGQVPAHFHAPSGESGTKRQRLNVQSDVAANATFASVDSFRIKNRGVGGLRVLQPGAIERDAKKLQIMDKIREFADKTGATVQRKLELKHLSNMERAVAHEYCEELGLSHDSKGQEPNRFIVVKRPDSDDVPADQLTVDEKKEIFDDKLKKKIHAHDDALCELQTDTVDLGREGWKQRYYQEKLDGVEPADIAREYIGGLVWVFKYYYMGCQSWNWFFPYHYSPFASDLAQLLAAGYTNPTFELGAPFKPYEQLMSVFPSASKSVLPLPFQELMDESSIIGDFYPLEFKLDLNGKRRLWQAVVLLPFIDEKRLLEHVRPLEEQLRGEEKKRNEAGHSYVFAHRTHPIAGLLSSAPPVLTQMPKAPSVTKMKELRAAQHQAEVAGNKELEAQFMKELEQVRAEAAAYLAAMKLKDGLPIDPSPACGNGMVGNVCMPPDQPALGSVVKAPAFEGVRTTSSYRPHDLPSNNVVCAVHTNPNSGLHKTSLLPGLTMPPRELTSMDGPVIDQSRIRRRVILLALPPTPAFGLAVLKRVGGLLSCAQRPPPFPLPPPRRHLARLGLIARPHEQTAHSATQTVAFCFAVNLPGPFASGNSKPHFTRSIRTAAQVFNEEAVEDTARHAAVAMRGGRILATTHRHQEATTVAVAAAAVAAAEVAGAAAAAAAAAATTDLDRGNAGRAVTHPLKEAATVATAEAAAVAGGGEGAGATSGVIEMGEVTREERDGVSAAEADR